MSKTEKQMIGVIVIAFFVIVFFIIGNFAIEQGKKAYGDYVSITDSYKEKCLVKFKTVDYEVVNDELYCKSVDGLVRFK